MKADKLKSRRRIRRKRGIRKRLMGTADCPRLTVLRSLKNISAQIIDDQRGVTLCAAGTMAKDLRGSIANGGNIAAAKVVGAALGKLALGQKISSVCFDRNGYRFHGRIKGLADAAREAGLQF